MGKRVGVIGAGISGAWIAKQLQEAGHEITVFEKSRGFGGRMATRRSGELAFDHGAQFFTARSEAFKNLLDSHSETVKEWQPKLTTLGEVSKPYKRDWFEPHYVCVPTMGSLCRSLLSTGSVLLATEVSRLERRKGAWVLTDKEGTPREFDWIVSSAPAEQTMNLIPDAPLEKVTYSPCFALMAELKTRPGFDAAVVRGEVLEWLAITSSRPARPKAHCIVAHADARWSQEHFDDDRDKIIETLLEELKTLGVRVGTFTALHRWKYARVQETYSETYWLQPELGIAACGDWGVGPRVEDAFTSANQLLPELLREIGIG